MNWLATDSLGRRWYPYIMTNLKGKHEILMHPGERTRTWATCT